MSTDKYLPYGQDALIRLHIDLDQDVSLGWHIDIEVLTNLMWPDQSDPRRLCRFIDQYGSFSHVATPVDDGCVPAYPARNDDGRTSIPRIRLVFPPSDRAERMARETMDGVLADLDEYIRTVHTLADDQLRLSQEFLVG